MGYTRQATLSDWIAATTAPTLWPVIGPITGAFGERIDPFNGEGAFHAGVDISCHYGQQVIAPADGIVTFAGPYNGYGRMIEVDHGNGITTRYGHLSGVAVADGETVHKGQIIGYVGLTGRSTGPHLHYEVRIHDTPVNPHKYLRTTASQRGNLPGDVTTSSFVLDWPLEHSLPAALVFRGRNLPVARSKSS